jgi:hypothetical protein
MAGLGHAEKAPGETRVAIAADNHELMAALCMGDGHCPPFVLLAGHNHTSEILSADTTDDRLGGGVLAFYARSPSKSPSQPEPSQP